jgi:hypothetical protein
MFRFPCQHTSYKIVLQKEKSLTLAILKQELSTHLFEISAFERLFAGAETLEDGLDRVYEDVGLHVFRLRP